MLETREGGIQYEHTLDHALEFFSKAGSLFEKRESFYGGEDTALSLFQKIWIVDKPLAFKLLMWLRDCRGGAGNRSGARSCYRWLAEREPDSFWLSANMELLLDVGRWDDLRSFWTTPMEMFAAIIWGANLEKNILAAKWADRSDRPLQRVLKTNEAGLRKKLADIRKSHIVEHKMCTDRWGEVEYSKVPSVAMARYTNAFKRHDEERFEKYKKDLVEGKETVHADVLFPHDCVRTVLNGDHGIGNAQFDALPNFMDTDERVIVISDTSGSMITRVSGSVQAVHVSQGMALYCSAKIQKGSPFYKKFIGFCSEGKFKNWNGMSFSEAIYDREIFDRAIGSTRIDKALDLILETARFFNLADSFMPTMLLIISDMQFHSGTEGFGTEIQNALLRWIDAGYSKPKIIYWNVAGYIGSPETVDAENVALVSGFSPAILKAIFSGEDIFPKAVMLRTLEKYNINIPE